MYFYLFYFPCHVAGDAVALPIVSFFDTSVFMVLSQIDFNQTNWFFTGG